MKKNFLFMALALCCAFAMTSCSSDDGDEKEPEDLGVTLNVTPVTGKPADWAYSNNEMYEGGDLYFQVTREAGKAITVAAISKATADKQRTSPTSIIVPQTIICGKEKLTVNKIGLFQDSYDLKSVEFPKTITEIADRAFYWCHDLTSIKIPESVTSIGDNAFFYCEQLTSVNIPESVNHIGKSAFAMCRGLRSFTGKFASADHRCLIEDGNLIAFAPGGLPKYTIPSNVTAIGEYAMAYSKLTLLEIPSSVTTIADNAFYNCSQLVSVVVPNSVTTIGNYAFGSCYELTSLTLSNSLTTIGTGAFSGCEKLTAITSLSTTPPTLGADCFRYIPASCTLRVPAQAVEAYKAAEGWSAFQNVVGI